METSTQYKVLDLFSDLGGFSLGLERTGGFKTIAFCEIEEYPRSILRKHWPNVPIFHDIRRLHATDIPDAPDIITGGYPCQPFSVAGKRRGAKDDRHLWPEIVRLIREMDAAGKRAAWCLFENVAGHITMGLDTVLSDLEKAGYAAWPLVIPACALNAPHRRDRVWIVAHANGAGRQESYAPPESDWPRHSGGRGDAADANKEWTTELPVCGPDDGIPDHMARLKIKALGNSLVPQIVELIGWAILAASHLAEKGEG